MNIWANLVFLSSLIGCVAFCLRLNALGAEKAGDAAASDKTRVAMLIMAAVCGFHAQVALFLQTADWTEFVLSLGIASYAVQMWLNARAKVTVPMRQGLAPRS